MRWLEEAMVMAFNVAVVWLLVAPPGAEPLRGLLVLVVLTMTVAAFVRGVIRARAQA